MFARLNTALVPGLIILFVLLALPGAEPSEPGQISVLIINGEQEVTQTRVDFDWLKKLHEEKGFHFDVHYYGRENRPLTRGAVSDYNALVVVNLPTVGNGDRTEACPRSMETLLNYAEEGGGIFFMPYVGNDSVMDVYGAREWDILGELGIRVCHDWIVDEENEAAHPRHGRTFIYADNVLDSPVSGGVSGIWFPNDNNNMGRVHPNSQGFPVWPLDDDWKAVVTGSETSSTMPIPPEGTRIAGFTSRQREEWQNERFFSPDNSRPPVLFAVREAGPARLAVTSMNPIYHIRYGTSYIHDGVVVDKGLEGVPSDFGKLFANTLKWLAEPSIESGSPGGYVQNPDVITHPHFRKEPEEFFPTFDSYQNPTPRANVYRGIIGAQTSFSSGEGTVREWAEEARREGIDFIVFLEEFTAFSEEKLAKLEEQCLEYSSEDLALIPGFTIKTNVGNYEWYHGFDHSWPVEEAIDEEGRLMIQLFDENGELAHSAGSPARGWRWHYIRRTKTKNIGFYNFENSEPGHVPVRNLRQYGMLGVVAYVDGQFVEDVTDSYFKLLPQTNTPRISAVSILKSPREMADFLSGSPYLTHVAADSVEDIPGRMRYGHQYGRDNVNFSSGPRIHSWAGNHRVMTYAGESFVTGRSRVPVLASVTSDAGLDEIRIYRDHAGEGARLFRRIKLDGEKEFENLFEWGYDRQSLYVLEAIDVDGNRALSASFEMSHDGNWHSWCNDRHNGELWHGPFVVHGTWNTGVRNPYSKGYTWDGGGSLTRYTGMNVRIDRPNLTEIDSEGNLRGDSRRMEGHTYTTCIDDTVRNIAGVAWNEYAPGRVTNSYGTLGPIKPSERLRLYARRTEYMARPVGPHRDWHPMWSEREGGAMALHEGSVEILRDMKVHSLRNAGSIDLVSFHGINEPVWFARKSPEDPAPVKLEEDLREITIRPGGYIGVFGSEAGTPSMVVNMGERPVSVRTQQGVWSSVSIPDIEERSVKAGEKIEYSLMYIYDCLAHDDRSPERMDYIWRHYGLDGRGGEHGLEVKRGNLAASSGLVDIEAENGLVEFTVPEPDVEPALDIPLGVRFFGFNPNWTAGILQVDGYTPGFHNEEGKGLYRNLGIDDKDISYLGVYTHGTALSHIIAGHPVIADNPDININVAKLTDSPARWRVDVNNPTDIRIRTNVRVNIPELGIPLEETSVVLEPGEYRTLIRQEPPAPREYRRVTVERPDFLSLVDRKDNGSALRAEISGSEEDVPWQSGVDAVFKEPALPEEGKSLSLLVSFHARAVEGAPRLVVLRPHGGSTREFIRLGADWERHEAEVVLDEGLRASHMRFSLVGDDWRRTADGTYEIDNVSVLRIGEDGEPYGENLLANGSFDGDIEGWTARYRRREAVE